MKKLIFALAALLCITAFVGCAKEETQTFEEKIPERIAFSYTVAGDEYFCQIIGSSVFVYEDYGENTYGRFCEYKDGKFSFYTRSYNDDKGWVANDDFYKDYDITGFGYVLRLFTTPSYAFNVAPLSGNAKVTGTNTIAGVECDIYAPEGYDGTTYAYDKTHNMVLEINTPDAFYFSVTAISTGVKDFLDSPDAPTDFTSADYKAVFKA